MLRNNRNGIIGMEIRTQCQLILVMEQRMKNKDMSAKASSDSHLDRMLEKVPR